MKFLLNSCCHQNKARNNSISVDAGKPTTQSSIQRSSYACLEKLQQDFFFFFFANGGREGGEDEEEGGTEGTEMFPLLLNGHTVIELLTILWAAVCALCIILRFFFLLSTNTVNLKQKHRTCACVCVCSLCSDGCDLANKRGEFGLCALLWFVWLD